MNPNYTPEQLEVQEWLIPLMSVATVVFMLILWQYPNILRLKRYAITRRLGKKIIVLPTWLLYKMFRSTLPKAHIWHGKNFTLHNWAVHSTPINDNFSKLFWIAIIAVSFVLIFVL